MPKTRTFPPTPATPAIVVTMTVVVAFSTFLCCKSAIDTGVHGRLPGVDSTCDDLAKFACNFFAADCLCVSITRQTLAPLVDTAAHILVDRGCVSSVQNHASRAVHSIVVGHGVLLRHLVKVGGVGWRSTSAAPP